MTEQQNTEQQTPPVDEVVDEVVDDRPTPSERRQEAVTRVLDETRQEYLDQTALSRKGDPSRVAAYDTTRLAFIEGTIGTSSKAARDAAKALGHEGDHIETRPV